LATVRSDGTPHLVPIVFALEADTLCFAVDGKPKSTTALQRLANIAAQPRVSVLADCYDEDWARADGLATVADAVSAHGRHAVGLLVACYPQYREQRPSGPVVTVRVDAWTGWSAT